MASHHRGAGSAAAGAGLSDPAFEYPEPEIFSVYTLHEADIDPLREKGVRF
jgi:hypothetical protein